MHVDALVHAVVLQRADHLEPGAVADVRQPRVAVTAEVALQDAAVLGAVEQRAPRLELADALGRLLRVDLRHPEVVQVLAAAHRVREMDPPVVAIVGGRERGRDPALGHHGVGLAQQRLADERDARAGRGGLDRGPEPGAASSDDQDVARDGAEVRHQTILQSCQTPDAQSRT